MYFALFKNTEPPPPTKGETREQREERKVSNLIISDTLTVRHFTSIDWVTKCIDFCAQF